MVEKGCIMLAKKCTILPRCKIPSTQHHPMNEKKLACGRSLLLHNGSGKDAISWA